MIFEIKTEFCTFSKNYLWSCIHSLTSDLFSALLALKPGCRRVCPERSGAQLNRDVIVDSSGTLYHTVATLFVSSLNPKWLHSESSKLETLKNVITTFSLTAVMNPVITSKAFSTAWWNILFSSLPYLSCNGNVSRPNIWGTVDIKSTGKSLPSLQGMLEHELTFYMLD